MRSGRSGLKIGCSYVSIAAKLEPTTVQLQDGNNWVGSSSAERYGATVNHGLHESTILGWCRNGKHHILVNKSEYYRLEIWSNFSNLPCTGNGLAGPLDLDLSKELMKTNHRKKLHEKPTKPKKNPKPTVNKHREQKSLTYKKETKSLLCLNNIKDIAFIIWKVL